MENIPTTSQTVLMQVPKEFRKNNHEKKSSWALVSIVVILILFGVFFFIRKQQIISEVPLEQNTTLSPSHTSVGNISDLEASVGAITIPDYTTLEE